ncbi:GGDEF domain-containing protein [Paenibacillus filicis]|uniref:GGDEF domain-containing protein n=1 Tax=Paenibacillus gyeongsangnamensis TaxID=3388067 RepID=A0ABT4QDH3_9BACL|nr:diguanylate cyclase [Paenibacillus filicis]MCZ8514929.1 GGDEF domain-containing protein [Paenibacillus filicis]
MSDLDGLTGIANRRKLDRFLGNAWLTAAEEGTPISVILFDVDYFKPYNDTCGHQGGDEILKNIALAAAGLLQNTPHLIARYGGEEFAAVLAGAKQAEALAIAERLRRSVETLNMPHATSPIADHVTVSLGCATVIPQPGMTDKHLIDWADKALYRAKAEGRNRTVCHLPQDAPDKQGGC